MIKLMLYIFGLTLIFTNTIFSDSKEIDIDSLLFDLRLSKENVKSVENYNKQITEVFRTGLPMEIDSFQLFIESTIQIAREIEDKPGLATANYNLGKLFISFNSEYAKATPYLLESLSLFEELDDSAGISKCYMQIGLISYMMQYYEDAVKNFSLSLNYMENPTSIYLIAISYSEMDMFEQSKKYFFKAISDFQLNNNTSSVNECYMYMGKLYEKQGMLDSAFYYLEMAIENMRSGTDTRRLSRPYALISGTYLKVNDISKAIYYAETSYELSKIGTDRISPVLSTETLSKAYEIKGDYKKAYYYLDLHHTLKNKSFEGNTKQKIAEMQSMFDFKKKMHEEKLRHQEEIYQSNQTRNIILTTGVLMVLIAGGLYSRLRYIRRSKAILEQEKERSDSLLLNILPEEIAQELKETGKAEARNYDNVSILFTDFKEFTLASEKLSAKELVAEINFCYEEFDAICEKYKIEKIKTIGDSFMAAGGLPIPTSESVKNTVMAALEMQEFVRKRKAEMDMQDKLAFEMRVGIHTGSVIAGIVGVKKFQYDVWGETVNTASRMESHGEAEKVNISQSTYESLKDEKDLTFESRGKIEAKGIGEVSMWFVSIKS